MKLYLLILSLLLAGSLSAQPYYSADWITHGPLLISAYGWSMSNAGDVNGDGYDDLIVSSIDIADPEDEEGKLYLFYGGPDGLALTPAWTFESNFTQCILGFSTDGGDLNGDGYSDIVAGSIQWESDAATQNDEGRIWLWYGSPTGPASTPDWNLEMNQAYALLGSGVALGGDINSDGYNDLFVSAKMWDGGETDEGKTWMYWGSPTGPVYSGWSWEPNQAYAISGFPVNYAGDVNGDGYDDVIIGANQYDYAQLDDGLAVAFYGSATGLSSTPDWQASGGQKKCNFGHWCDGAGDVNGDGYDDVIVASLLYDHPEFSEGRVWVYLGSASGLSTTPVWTGESNQEGAQLGYSCAGAGDINGDGYSDVIAGAKYWTNGENQEGGGFIAFGSPSGPETNWCWQDESNQALGFYGRHVGGNADFNGDGYSDFFASAYRYSDSLDQDGRAYVYYGKPRENEFHYSAASYATSDPDPSPIIDGMAGGTFSAAPGLSINTTTGVIDVSASTVGGPYNVTYTVNSQCTLSKTVQVSITSSCGTPTGIHVSAVTSTTATIQWGAVAGATGYRVYIRKNGSPAAKYNVATNLYNATGLVPSSSYKTWVETRCGAVYSAASAKKSFTTAAGRQENAENELFVYPNPAGNTITIAHTGNDLILSVAMTDISGHTLKTWNQDQVQKNIDISGFPVGVYFLSVITQARRTEFRIIHY